MARMFAPPRVGPSDNKKAAPGTEQKAARKLVKGSRKPKNAKPE